MRVRHDLLGCANRLRQSNAEFVEKVQDVMEFWRDSRAERFAREDIKDIDSAVDRLVVHLQEAAEMVAKIDRQLADTDLSS